ncbi:tetratricopeptide repeat protein, partial [Kitasatospora sp. NPDC056446]|uniref:tetratricopeptide repeat protein n=1 Tax=Kitasatospora sp. NPDC056446 TaxID=3345819 RepID=UPI0036AC8365
TRSNLANAYARAGDLGRATGLFESVLADRERVLGGDHPQTLTTRSNLANAYARAGDLGRATGLFESVLADRERILGGDHPQTHSSRNNLAEIYATAGALDRAIPLFARALAAMERVHGPGHPDSSKARRILATLAVALTDRGRTLLPGDTAGAWRDAAAVVEAIGPRLAGAPSLYGPLLARAYLLAADVLDADGQPEAADEYRRRATRRA